MLTRSIRQEEHNVSPEKSPLHNPNKIGGSGGSARVTTADSTTTTRYQELLDGSDIHRQAGDGTARGGDADPARSSPFQQLEFYVSPSAMEDSSKGHGTSASSVGATDELSTSEDREREYREPGLLGSDGVLATPNVKIILLLGCINSVRRETTAR